MMMIPGLSTLYSHAAQAPSTLLPDPPSSSQNHQSQPSQLPKPFNMPLSLDKLSLTSPAFSTHPSIIQNTSQSQLSNGNASTSVASGPADLPRKGVSIPPSPLAQDMDTDEEDKEEGELTEGVSGSDETHEADTSDQVARIRSRLDPALAQAREDAKQFLLNWTNNGFTFMQLIAEGLDPHFLSDLYLEVGVDMDVNQPKRISQPLVRLTNGTANVATGVLKTPVDFTTSSTTSKSTGANSNAATESHFDISTNGSELRQEVVATTVPAVNSIQQMNQQPSILPARPVAGTADSQKPAPVDRKDYIARLQAAKAKRSSAVISTPQSPVPADVQASASNAANLATDTSQVRSAAEVQTTATPLSLQTDAQVIRMANIIPPADGTLSASLEELTLAAKRRAQTELARRRLQALASAKAAAPKSGASASVAESSRGGYAAAAPIVEQPRHQSIGAMPTLPLSSGSEERQVKENALNRDEIQIDADPVIKEVDAVVNADPHPLASLLDNSRASSAGVVNSSTGSTTPHRALPHLLTTSSMRKRPVAADFDGGPPTKIVKRPFGEEPGIVEYEDMVIEVSDDDSVEKLQSRKSVQQSGSLQPSEVNPELELDVEVAANEEAEKIKRREEQIAAMKRKIAEMELKRRAKAAIASRSGTPSTPQPRSNGSANGYAVTATADVDEFLNSVITGVPATTSAPIAQPVQEVSAVTDVPESFAISGTTQPAVLFEAATRNTREMETMNATDPSAIASALSSDLPMPSSTRRREEIRSRLPLLDANVVARQSKLAFLKAQMQALENDMLREQEEKDQLVQELESFGIDTEGMPRTELQAVKDSLDAQAIADRDTQMDLTQDIVTVQAPDVHVQSQEEPLNKSAVNMTRKAAREIQKAAELTGEAETIFDEASSSPRQYRGETKVEANRDPRRVNLPISTQQSREWKKSEVIDLDGSESGEIEEVQTRQQSLEASHTSEVVPEVIEDVDDSHSNLTRALSRGTYSDINSGVQATTQPPYRIFIRDFALNITRDDIQDLFRDYPVVKIILKIKQNPKKKSSASVFISGAHRAHHAVTWLQGSIVRGQALRLEHESKKHLDAGLEATSVVDGHDQVSQDSVIDLTHTDNVDIPAGSAQIQGADKISPQSPTDNVSPQSPVEDDSPQSPVDEVFVQATATYPNNAAQDDLPQLTAGGESSSARMEDITTSELETSHELDALARPQDQSIIELDSETDSDYEPAEVLPTTSNQDISMNDSVLSTDNIRSTFDPTDDAVPIAQDDPPSAETDTLMAGAQGHFKPYVSALSNFKAYRYHPAFSAEVEAGIKSLTYSHNIDPNKELCWFEAQGGACNDPECDDQHFREIEIGDDEILRQIGADNPGRTREEREEYKKGLRQVIEDLRSRNLEGQQAVTTTAEIILEYRRSFLQDPSRILGI